jgi:hypothetical protein
MRKSNCTVTLEQLLDFREDNNAELAAHIAMGCPSCSERLAFLGDTLPAISSMIPAPSASATHYANSLARLLAPTKKPGIVQQIARLIPKPARPAIGLGVRGLPTISTVAAAQQTYETETHLITLWDEPEKTTTRYLIGQIYARSGEAVLTDRVTLLLSDATEQVATIEGSEFHFASVPSGVYLIRCEFDQTELLIPKLSVGRW